MLKQWLRGKRFRYRVPFDPVEFSKIEAGKHRQTLMRELVWDQSRECAALIRAGLYPPASGLPRPYNWNFVEGWIDFVYHETTPILAELMPMITEGFDVRITSFSRTVFHIPFDERQMQWGNDDLQGYDRKDRLLKLIWTPSKQREALLRLTTDYDVEVSDYEFEGRPSYAEFRVRTDSLSIDDLVWLKCRFQGVRIYPTDEKTGVPWQDRAPVSVA